MYSREQLARIFLNWPAYIGSSNLDDAIIWADILDAVAKHEEISVEEAAHGLSAAWLTISRLSSLQFVAGALAFADIIGGTINGKV